jgi:hypothetical protein
VGQGPAKEITFGFSHPIETSDGVLISELPLFTIGLTSLAPGARITCYWDDLHDQLEMLRDRGLEGSDFQVTVRYLDLPGAQYSHEWDIQPGIYEGLRSPPHPERHVDDQAGESGDAGGGSQGSPPEPTGQPAVAASVGERI